MLGTGGIVPPPATYWAKIQAVLRSYDILLIADEVITGFGRLGAMFGSDFYGMEPDLITIAKGLTSAYAPLSGVIVSEKIWKILVKGSDKLGPIGHGWTYSSHPLCTAAGVANLELVDSLGLVDNARDVGAYFRAALADAVAANPIVGEVRGEGLLAAVEFAADRDSATAFDPALKVGARVAAALLERGVIGRAMPGGDILGFAPPLCLTRGRSGYDRRRHQGRRSRRSARTCRPGADGDRFERAASLHADRQAAGTGARHPLRWRARGVERDHRRPGVSVGYTTLIAGDGPLVVGQGPVRTGVTAILPRRAAHTLEPVFAGIYSQNGNGEMTGAHIIEEVGAFTLPITITNTHACGIARDATIAWINRVQPGGLDDAWGLPVAAETYDGFLNDINGGHVSAQDVEAAIEAAASGPIEEGSVGGGTGMICLEFKGGSGTASRRVAHPAGTFTLAAFVQANFGRRRNLTVRGLRLGSAFAEPALVERTPKKDKSSIIGIIATDAPLLPHQLKRLARRAPLGVALTGGYAYHSSGDIFLAFSTANGQALTVPSKRHRKHDLPARRRARPVLRCRRPGDRGGDPQCAGRQCRHDRPRRQFRAGDPARTARRRLRLIALPLGGRSVIVCTAARPSRPAEGARAARRCGATGRAMANDKLDAFDIRILALLQKNGRIKKVDLASAVGLSLSSCWDRLRNLEDAGYIREYRAEIDLARLVKTELIIATMTLETPYQAGLRPLRAGGAGDSRRSSPATLSAAASTTCSHIVAHDIEHYQQLIDRMLELEIGISVYFTYVVTKTVKRFEGVPIAELLDYPAPPPRNSACPAARRRTEAPLSGRTGA